MWNKTKKGLFVLFLFCFLQNLKMAEFNNYSTSAWRYCFPASTRKQQICTSRPCTAPEEGTRFPPRGFWKVQKFHLFSSDSFNHCRQAGRQAGLHLVREWTPFLIPSCFSRVHVCHILGNQRACHPCLRYSLGLGEGRGWVPRGALGRGFPAGGLSPSQEPMGKVWKEGQHIQSFLPSWWQFIYAPALLVGMQAVPVPWDVSVAISQGSRKQPFSIPSNTTFGYISKISVQLNVKVCHHRPVREKNILWFL